MDKLLARLPSALLGLWDNRINQQECWKGSWPEWKCGKNNLQNIPEWLEERRKLEGAEGLWRVHDKLYDLETWAAKHPGGKYWIEITKGTDVTEAFETYHVNDTAALMLPTFYIRDATSPRNSPFTFKENGFYRTLKAKVKRQLYEEKRSTISSLPSNLTDSLLVGSLGLAVAGAFLRSYSVLVLSGVLLCCLCVAAHNYFHKRDNFRMYYFNLTLLSYREWRISHGLSHHLFPNSRYDIEVTMFYPWFQWFPKENKTIMSRYISCLYAPIVYILIFHVQWLQRMFLKPEGWEEVIPLVYPISMVLFGGATLWEAFLMWHVVLFSGSLCFGIVGINAAHHHPDILHDGDTPREDKDWGLYTLDTVRDRRELKGHLGLVMILFGDHTLHHLFPTLDHGLLHALYPLLEETCLQFGHHFQMTTAADVAGGQFRQLARTLPSPHPPK